MKNTNTKIIAVANQKGGAGKTTTAVNVAASMQEMGYKVLLIDLDPQNSLTTSYLKHEFDPNQPTISELMNGIIEKRAIDLLSCICHNEANDIDYIPADIRLSNVERQLVVTRYSETVLQKALKKAKINYDYIIIDCPPSLSTLLYNALCASDYVLVPVAAQPMALDGVPMLLDTVSEVKENVNSDLQIIGYIATVYEDNTRLSKDVVDTLVENFGDDYIGYVTKTTSAPTSALNGYAALHYSVNSTNAYFNRLAAEYKKITQTIIERCK